MFIKKVSLKNYKVLDDISISLEKRQDHNVFPLISTNGGGKSTLLQIIFSFLHCAFQEERYKYLKTSLSYFRKTNQKQKFSGLIQFELEHNGEMINLEFFQSKNGFKNLNFNSILTLKELQEEKLEIRRTIRKIELLNNLERDLKNGNLSSTIVSRELESFFKSRREQDIFRRGNDTQAQLKFIQKTRRSLEVSLKSEDELNILLIKVEAERNKLLDELEKNNLRYAFHFHETENILLYKSNANDDILKEISNRIYLATPNTQVLHFLEEEQLSSLFSTENYIYSSYEHYINECKKDVTGLFTYDFSAINLILDAFKKARDFDTEKAIKTGKYGNQIQTTRDELNNLLVGKSIVIDSNFKGVTFKAKTSNIELSPKDLSHGELKKLSIYIWLKAKTSDNSVILMDEVDMGLHPTWQHELYNDLQRWSSGNQFMLATHSPQIISMSYFKNLVVLRRSENKVIAEQFDTAPIESDLNTIVKTVMGGDYIPKELKKLRSEYRLLFEKNELNSDEAKKIKAEILNYESENSSFFQDIKFQLELRA